MGITNPDELPSDLKNITSQSQDTSKKELLDDLTFQENKFAEIENIA
jgi:hypothetical protein